MELRCVPEVPPSVSSGHGLAALLACTAAEFHVLCSDRTLRRCGFPLLVCIASDSLTRMPWYAIGV